MASPPFLTSKKRKNTDWLQVETKPIRSPFERKDRKKAQRNAQDDDSDDIMIVDDTIDDDAPAATSSRTITPKKKNDFAPKRQSMPPWSGGGKSGFDFTHDARIAVAVSKIGTAATSAAPGLKNNDRIPNSPFLPTERISGRPVGGDWAGTEKKMVERHEKREKRSERDRFRPRGLASINDFKSAAGGSANKPFAQVVDKTSDDSENNISPAQMPKRFLGTKPLGRGFNPPQMIQQAIKPPVVTEERNGLADEPSLKHFDNNIIALIESEIMSITKETGWTDVAGLEGAKKALREIVVLPFMRPNFFKGIRAPPKGVLLFGPPGTGKTMIGRCVASQCKATFFNISASSLTSKWVGEGEKLVRALFAVARLKLPAVIFIDEIDSLLCSRSESEHESSRRLKTEFLVQLDGVATNSEEKLLVLGATNRPQELDEAARRRFAKRLYIALPDLDARVSIVQKLLEGQKHDLTIENMDEIGRITDGYSGADMRQLCAEASMGPIRDIDNSSSYNIETISEEEIRDISIDDFRQAKRVVRPTVVKADLENYRKWDRQFGCLLQPPDGSVDENDAASVE